MKPEFSEFSFGFALSYEIMNGLQPQITGVPLFPSLVQEAELGWDVNFKPTGWPLFLQFKLSDHMQRSRARYWSLYGSPYFSIAIRRRDHSQQHNLLKALATFEPEVYYAAPAFYREADFNTAFVSNTMTVQTMFIPLASLPSLDDDDQHHVTFPTNPSGFSWHSNHRGPFHESIFGREFIAHLQNLGPRRLGRELTTIQNV